MSSEAFRTVANIEVNLSTIVYNRTTFTDGDGNPNRFLANSTVSEVCADGLAVLAFSGVVETNSLQTAEEVTKLRISDQTASLAQEITSAKEAVVKVNERSARLRAASAYICGAGTIIFGSRFAEEVSDNGFNVKSAISGILALGFAGFPLIQSVAISDGTQYSFVGAQRKTLDTLVESSKRLQKLEMLSQNTTTITKT